MNLRIFLTTVLAALVVTDAVLPAHATTNYTYKPNEYVVVENGLSPDRQFSIAAHGEGELGFDNFHIYLMDARSGKKIGPLEQIDRNLDTGASAFHAQWSSDSRHVAISYRIDRRIMGLVMFRIENRRAYAVSGPNLLQVAAPNVNPETFGEWTAGYFQFKWLSDKRFTLQEQRIFRQVQPNSIARLGNFWKSEKNDYNSDGSSPIYFAQFSADAVCELTPGGKYKVVEIKPGKFRQ